MKFPKLKHPVLCQIILYLPTLIPFIILLIDVILGLESEWSVILFLVLTVVDLVFLIKKAPIFMAVDLMLHTVRSFLRSRDYYISDINCSDIETAKNKITKRIPFLAKEYTPVSRQITPDVFRIKRYTPETVEYSKIEKYYFIYSVDYLDERNYTDILASVRANIKEFYEPFKSKFYTDKRRKKAPFAKCSAVVILAKSVSPNVLKFTENTLEDKYYGCILPCICDITKNKYYFYSIKEYASVGFIRKPEINFAIDMVKKIVFAGKLPLKNTDKSATNLPVMLSELSKEDDGLELSLWEALRFFEKEFKEADVINNKQMKKLHDKKVLITESSVLLKIGERAISLPFIEIDENETNISVLISENWDYPKTSKISLKDMELIKNLVSAELTEKGYTYIFDTESLRDNYKKIFN